MPQRRYTASLRGRDGELTLSRAQGRACPISGVCVLQQGPCECADSDLQI